MLLGRDTAVMVVDLHLKGVPLDTILEALDDPYSSELPLVETWLLLAADSLSAARGLDVLDEVSFFSGNRLIGWLTSKIKSISEVKLADIMTSMIRAKEITADSVAKMLRWTISLAVSAPTWLKNKLIDLWDLLASRFQQSFSRFSRPGEEKKAPEEEEPPPSGARSRTRKKKKG